MSSESPRIVRIRCVGVIETYLELFESELEDLTCAGLYARLESHLSLNVTGPGTRVVIILSDGTRLAPSAAKVPEVLSTDLKLAYAVLDTSRTHRLYKLQFDGPRGKQEFHVNEDVTFASLHLRLEFALHLERTAETVEILNSKTHTKISRESKKIPEFILRALVGKTALYRVVPRHGGAGGRRRRSSKPKARSRSKSRSRSTCRTRRGRFAKCK